MCHAAAKNFGGLMTARFFLVCMIGSSRSDKLTPFRALEKQPLLPDSPSL